MTHSIPGSSSPRSDKTAGESQFFSSVQHFMKFARTEGIVKPGDEKDLEAFIASYGAVYEDNYLERLCKEDARRLHLLQKEKFPELSEHPFFRDISNLLRLRFGEKTQGVIDAHNYLIQKDLGASPENIPLFVDVVTKARKEHSSASVAQHAVTQMVDLRSVSEQGHQKKPELHGKYLTETLSEVLARFAKRHSK